VSFRFILLINYYLCKFNRHPTFRQLLCHWLQLLNNANCTIWNSTVMLMPQKNLTDCTKIAAIDYAHSLHAAANKASDYVHNFNHKHQILQLKHRVDHKPNHSLVFIKKVPLHSHLWLGQMVADSTNYTTPQHGHTKSSLKIPSRHFFKKKKNARMHVIQWPINFEKYAPAV